MAKPDKQPISLTVFSTDRTSSQLRKLIEGLKRSATEWVQGTSVHPEGTGKYGLEKHFAGHEGTHTTVQVMRNQLWVGENGWFMEGVLQSHNVLYLRARLKARPSYLAERKKPIQIKDEDVDLRYSPKTTVRLLE